MRPRSNESEYDHGYRHCKQRGEIYEIAMRSHVGQR